MKVAEKARAVRACIRNGIALGIDAREIFRLSYGDESGSEYWKVFLNQPMTESELIRALATHLATPFHANIESSPTVPMVELPTARLTAIIAQIPAEMKPVGSKAFPDAIIQVLVRMSPDELPSSLLAYLQPRPNAEPSTQPPANISGPQRVKRKPGPKPVESERLANAMRVWTADHGLDALRELKLEEAMCTFESAKTLTFNTLEKVRGEFGVRGW
jgi:hypothetical protein